MRSFVVQPFSESGDDLPLTLHISMVSCKQSVSTTMEDCYSITVTFLTVVTFLMAVIIIGNEFPRLPHFQVDSLSLTNSISSESVTNRWQVGILVKNRNKNLDVNYKMFKLTVYNNEALISKSLLMPFRQGSMSETTLNVTFSAVDVEVEPFVWDGINKETREGGWVRFDVEIDGSIWFGPRKGFNIFLWRRMIHVSCNGVVISISSNNSSGYLDGGSTDCQANFSDY